MRSTGRLLAVAATLFMVVTPVAAQSVGLGKTAGSPGGTGPDVGHWDVEWPSWSEDEVVTRLVHQPVKLMRMNALGPEAVFELKQVVGRMEAGVREAVRSLSSGEESLADARATMEQRVVEYRLALEDIAAN